MKLIVGLGNPGKEYENTRHNIGFSCVDNFLKKEGIVTLKENFEGLFYKTNDYIILKPLTYMNLSGRSVAKVMQFYKIEVTDVLVIHDDLDLPVGYIRLRMNGGSGGHNGLKSIISEIGSSDFKRLRVGIGSQENVIEHVLGKFTNEEQALIDQAVFESEKIIKDFLTLPFDKVMSLHNKRK